MGLKVNKEELSKILGKSTTTLTTWQKNGLPIFQDGTKGKANIYDTSDVIQWLIDFNLGKLIDDSEIDQQVYSYEKERARKEKEGADKLGMENAQRRKELFPLEVLGNALENVVAQICAILDSIPVNIKRKIPELTASDIDIVKREIAKARNIASRSRIECDD